jgi:hypothetical protein
MFLMIQPDIRKPEQLILGRCSSSTFVVEAGAGRFVFIYPLYNERLILRR